MFLQLNHKNLDVYKVSRELSKECYLITLALHPDEKFNLVSQIRRASVSVKLNIAEGASRKSEVERKRYYEVARGSVVEIDAALEIVVDLNYLPVDKLHRVGELLNSQFALLTKLIGG